MVPSALLTAFSSKKKKKKLNKTKQNFLGHRKYFAEAAVKIMWWRLGPGLEQNVSQLVPKCPTFGTKWNMVQLMKQSTQNLASARRFILHLLVVFWLMEEGGWLEWSFKFNWRIMWILGEECFCLWTCILCEVFNVIVKDGNTSLLLGVVFCSQQRAWSFACTDWTAFHLQGRDHAG